MKWGFIYIPIAIIYGLYRQFIIPEQFMYEPIWIWGGAFLWPYLLVMNIASYILDIEELRNELFILHDFL